MGKEFFLILFGFALLVKPVFAVELKCVGQERGINTLTGVERANPFTYHIVIVNNKATLKELNNISFIVHETDDAYKLKGSIGKDPEHSRESRLLGEFTLQINKHTGLLSGKSWLFSRENVVTKEGRCERIDNGE
jgi:hypothetical protein